MDATGSHECDRKTGWQLDEVMEIASRLAGQDAVGAIHVVVGERPTYDDLLHYRQLAEANGLTLTLTADSVVLRPPHPPDPEAVKDIPTRVANRWTHGLRPAAHRAWTGLHRHSTPRNEGDRSLPRTP
jgi:hypothetical protein